MLRWYLVHTKPLSEAIAQANLERQGYQVYLPRLAQSVLGRHPRRERITPLFPRYLFLRLREGSQPLGPVRSSVGVRGVVRFGFRYAVVADDVICRLQARADALTGLHRLTKPAPLVTGAGRHRARSSVAKTARPGYPGARACRVDPATLRFTERCAAATKRMVKPD